MRKEKISMKIHLSNATREFLAHSPRPRFQRGAHRVGGEWCLANENPFPALRKSSQQKGIFWDVWCDEAKNFRGKELLRGNPLPGGSLNYAGGADVDDRAWHIFLSHLSFTVSQSFLEMREILQKTNQIENIWV